MPVYNKSSDSLGEIVARLPKELPAHGIGAAFYSDHGEALFNGRFDLLFHLSQILDIFHFRAHHSIPTTIAAWNTARLRTLAGGGMMQNHLSKMTDNSI